MGLDFNWLEDRHGPSLLTLEFEQIQAIQPALEALESRTGLCVDPYSDTRISNDHAKILADEIVKLKPENPMVLRFVDLLNAAVQKQEWLYSASD